MKSPGCFLKENIESQPEMVEHLLADTESVQVRAQRLATANRIFVVGTGTSFHGSLVGEGILRSIGRDSFASHAFEFSQYPPDLKADDGLIVISHRGTKQYSLAALELVSGHSDAWLVITRAGSPVEGDGVISTVSNETSPVITVSHLAAMLRLSQIAASLSDLKAPWIDVLPQLPSAVRNAVNTCETCREIADAINAEKTTFFVGGGPAWANALEGALKVREAAYISTIGYNTEEFLHGPTVGVDAEDTVILIAEPGPALARTQDVARVLDAIGAQTVVIGSAAGHIADAAFRVPTHPLPEVLAPMVNVIPLQWLAYFLSLRVGSDADSFRTVEAPYELARSRVQL